MEGNYIAWHAISKMERRNPRTVIWIRRFAGQVRSKLRAKLRRTRSVTRLRCHSSPADNPAISPVQREPIAWMVPASPATLAGENGPAPPAGWPTLPSFKVLPIARSCDRRCFSATFRPSRPSHCLIAGTVVMIKLLTSNFSFII
jgi:hypothetical protein